MYKPEDFQVVGYTLEEANRIDRPTISYWQDAWRRFKENKLAMVSAVILLVIILLAIFQPMLSHYEYDQTD